MFFNSPSRRFIKKAYSVVVISTILWNSIPFGFLSSIGVNAQAGEDEQGMTVPEEEIIPAEDAAPEGAEEVEEGSAEGVDEEETTEEEAAENEAVVDEPVTDEPVVVETSVEEPVIETPVVEGPIPVEPVVVPEIVGPQCVTDDSFVGSTVSDWEVNYIEDWAQTAGPVKLGVTYSFPQDPSVSIRFTCLPAENEITPLKIQRIKTSGLNLPAGVSAATEYAYDFTTGMRDGTFTYDVTLPKPVGIEDVEISYIEKTFEQLGWQGNVLSAVDLKAVDSATVEDLGTEIMIYDVDHFTIYIATYADAGLTVSESEYLQGDTVYVGAGDLNTSRFYRIDIFENDETTRHEIIICSTGVTTLAGSYSLSATAALGNKWRAELTRYNSLSDCTGRINTKERLFDEFTVKTTNPISLDNPTLSQACGLDIAIVIDVSGSISSSELTQMKNAFKAFVDALSGTPTQFSVTKFDTTATVLQPFTSDFALVKAKIDSASGGSCTNWDDGLSKANGTFGGRADKPDLILFSSDGNPNTVINGVGCGVNESTAVNAAVVQANAAKTLGRRILALGIGNELSVENLKAVSGHNVNTGNVLTSDVITSNFSQLAADLATFASQTCGATISVNKYIDTVSDQTRGGSGWSYSISGPTSVNLTSDAQGQANSGKVATGTYSVTETNMLSGYSYGSASCKNTQTGASVGTVIANGIGSIVVGNLDIISCDFLNTTNPGSITIIKDAQPENAQDFAFTTTGTGLSGFSLDDDANATLSNTKVFNSVMPGTYSVTESAVADWNLESIVCSSGGAVDLATRKATIDITPGLDVTCTFSNILQTGHIVIDKVTNPSGDQLNFSFTPSYGTSFALADVSTPHDSGALMPGTYTVSEWVPAGWDITGILCSDPDGGSTVDVPVAMATIDLDAGETVTCTFTNTKRGHIIVEKQTDPDGGTKSFEFDPSWEGNFFLSDNGTHDSGALVPGTYSIAEIEPVGWDLASAVCSDQSPVNDISLQAGETVTCTFTNIDLVPAIKVEKQAGDTSIPETGQDVTFTFEVSNKSQEEPVTITSLEDSVYGTLAGDGDCMVGTVLASGASCTFEITKWVEGDHSGADHLNTFTAIAVDGDGVQATDDDSTTIDFEDVSPAIMVTKTGLPVVVPETGGDVVFTFTVKNTSTEESVSITSLSDSVFGTLGGDADCEVGTTLAAGTLCEFSVTKHMSGDYTGPAHYNLFTAHAEDNDKTDATDNDDETIRFSDVAPAIRITKTADPTHVPETGGNVTFTFFVENIGPESVTLNSLSDTKFGNLNGKGTCSVPQTIGVGGSYSCAYTISLPASDNLITHTNVVTATAVDDDGTQATASDNESVIYDDVPPTIEVTKTANDTLIPETGQDVTFTIEVKNKSLEFVTLSSLIDSVFGNLFDHVLNPTSTCGSALIAPGGTYTCTVTKYLASDTLTDHYDMVTAVVMDNEGSTASGYDDETVRFEDVKPSVTLDKSVSPSSLAEPGGPFTYTLTITNNSDEEVTITSLTDTNTLSPQCLTLIGTKLAAKASTFCVYTVDHTAAGTYDNTARVEVVDNDRSTAASEDLETVKVVGAYITFDSVAETNDVNDPHTFTVTVMKNDGSGWVAAAGEHVGFTLMDADGAVSVLDAAVSTCDNAGPNTDTNGQCTITFSSASPGTVTVHAGVDVLIEDLVVRRSTDGMYGSSVDAVKTFEGGKIVIRKETLPNGSLQSFEFDPSWGANFHLTNGTSNNSGWLAPDTYTVSEIVPDGWDLTNIVCEGGIGETAGNLATFSAEIHLLAGEEITCTFTNTQKGKIIVEKRTLPSGASGSFEFEPSWSANFFLSDGDKEDSGWLIPGGYTVAEIVPAGWDLVNVTCNDVHPGAGAVGALGAVPVNGEVVNLDPGEIVTCVFTNDRKPLTIVATKIVCDNEADLPNWGIGGPNITSTTAADFLAAHPTCHLESGWDFQWGDQHDINPGDDYYGLAAGWNMIGTTDGSGSILVSIDDFGSASEIRVRENLKTGYIPFTFTTHGKTNDDNVSAELYCDVDVLNYDNDDRIRSPQYGGTYYCVAWNVMNAGTIRIVKYVVPDDAVTKFDYTLTSQNGFSASDKVWEGNPSGYVNIPVGSYTLTEYPPAGYVTSISCTNNMSSQSESISFELGLDEDVTCTITNSKQPKLTLVKVLPNDSGGTAVEGDFQAKIDGNDVDWGIATELSVGEHTASETTLSGYTPFGWSAPCAADGKIKLAAGDDVTCTITNDDEQAYIIVDKTVITDDGGTADAGCFSLTVDGSPTVDEIKYPVDPGSHTVGETNLPGYSAGSWGGDCDSSGNVTVALGETKTCTITNDDIAPTLKLVKEVVPDDGGDETAADWVLYADGDKRAFYDWGPEVGPYDVMAGTEYTLSETDMPGYTASSWVCTGGGVQDGNKITLGLDEDVVCTITNDDIAPQLTVVKTVINDNTGTAIIDDFDIKIDDTDLVFGPAVVDDPVNEPWKSRYFASPTVKANEEYVLSESNLPGYFEGKWECTDDNTLENVGNPFTLNEGQQVTCRITNDDLARIIVHKEVLDELGKPSAIDVLFDVSLYGRILDGIEDKGGVLTNGLIEEIEIVTLATGQISDPVTGDPQDAEFLVEPGMYIVDETPNKYFIFEGCVVLGQKNDSSLEQALDPELVPLEAYVRIGTTNDVHVTCTNRMDPPVLFIEKTNSWLDPDLNWIENPEEERPLLYAGDSVMYQIIVKALNNDVDDAMVGDVLPSGFTYHSGSWVAMKWSEALGEWESISIPEPEYDPKGFAIWHLGDMKEEDRIKLMFVADISSAQESGLYPDIAWTQGKWVKLTSEIKMDVLGNETDGIFVGTRVAVVAESPEETGVVLGTQTELIKTGQNILAYLVGAVALLVASLTAWFISKRRKGSDGKMKMIATTIGAMLFVWGAFFGHAAEVDAMSLMKVEIEQPAAIVTSDSFELGFSVAYLGTGTVSYHCQKMGPGEVSYEKFASGVGVAPAFSGSCLVSTSNVLVTDGDYKFNIVVMSEGGVDTVTSDEVSVTYDGTHPSSILNYVKTKVGDCQYKISFATAADSQTSRVDIYRGSTESFPADSTTRVTSMMVVPGMVYEFTDTTCDSPAYYVVRAFDTAGNASTDVGDIIVTTQYVVVPGGGGTGGTGGTGGEVEGAETEGEEAEGAEDNDDEEEEDKEDEDGEVLGEEDEDSDGDGIPDSEEDDKKGGINWGTVIKIGAAVIGVGALAGVFVMFRKKSR